MTVSKRLCIGCMQKGPCLVVDWPVFCLKLDSFHSGRTTYIYS